MQKSVKGQGKRNKSKVAIKYSRKWLRNIASNYAREYARQVVRKKAKNICKRKWLDPGQECMQEKQKLARGEKTKRKQGTRHESVQGTQLGNERTSMQ